MKRWTRHEPRANHLADVDQFNEEQVAHRGSMASLDRTQLPPLPGVSVFVPEAVHDMWLSDEGEQTEVRGLGVNSEQWLSITTRNYSGQAVECGSITLDGHKGGMTYVEWSGAGYVNAMSLLSVYHDGTMEKRIRLRVLVNGIVVAHSEGLLQGLESFRIFGTVFLPPGDHTLQLQAVGLPVGEDDPLVDNAGTSTIMLYHIINSTVFAFARYR